MTRILNHLSTLTIAGARTEVDKESGLEVLHVDNSHALVQAAGYLKYTQALKHKKGVFFRGQTKLYSSLTPSLLRGVNDGPPNVKRRERLNDFLANIDVEKRVLRNVNPGCREALLQHYGIRTTWIDIVDNVWIALWFACHEALVKGWPEQYLHFEKRIPGVKAQYAYLLRVDRKTRATTLNAALVVFAGAHRNGTTTRNRKLSAKGRTPIAAAQKARWKK